jgi:hypothetical protein
LCDDSLLLAGINFHQSLPAAHPIAGMNENLRQIAANLGLDGRGTSGLDGGNVIVADRHWLQRDRFDLYRHCHRTLRRRFGGTPITARGTSQNSHGCNCSCKKYVDSTQLQFSIHLASTYSTICTSTSIRQNGPIQGTIKILRPAILLYVR